MTRTALALAIALALPTVASATEIGSSRAFGLGIVLGYPSGVSGKYYIGGRTNAIDFSVGSYGYYYGNYGYGGWQIAAAYHWHFQELASGGGVAIPLRIGVGGFLTDGNNGWYGNRFRSDVAIGARVPFGIDFDLESAPVQFFIEVAALVPVYPGITVFLDAGLGGRYYF